MTKMQIIGSATTPAGQPGILIQCDCGTPHGTGRAVMRASARDGLTTHPERIHGFVTLAWHPVLSRAPQIRRDGPWQA
jgi:hypothetical protein